jgi:hypothetical protein
VVVVVVGGGSSGGVEVEVEVDKRLHGSGGRGQSYKSSPTAVVVDFIAAA